MNAPLGAGGFASVWTLDDGRVLKLAHVSHDLARARIHREAEALGAIGAPAVPKLHDTGILDDGRAWITMARAIGTTVADITSDGPQRIGDAVTLALAILDSLTRVHAARFVHRERKPVNLVRTADVRVVVLDLGLARKIPTDPDDPTRANVQVGSLEYMAPEQIEDSAAADERSDIYAFGCILYELCAGRPPFVGDAAVLERAHAAMRPARLGALATIPAEIEALCHECLAKEPQRRPPTALEARARLAVTHHSPATPSPRSIAILRESKQPVVLVWVELPRVDRALLALFAARRLVVVSQRGRRVLAGVLGGEHPDPAGVAIAAARELVTAGAKVALHVDALRIGATAGNATLHGEPVERPETWLPTGTWTGIVLTRALASITAVRTRDSAVGAEFRALADDQVQHELFGRDALLTDLSADAAVAVFGAAPPSSPDRPTGRRPRSTTRSGRRPGEPAGPAFALLVGDAGVGKTAFAAELGRRITDLGVRVHHGTIPLPGTGRPAHAALAELIGTPTAQPNAASTVRVVGDALRAAARERPTVVILDDLHLADHELFDALEYATLGGEPLPLWVLGVASPRIDTRRPHLGERADRHRRDLLQPLDEDAAVALAAALLRPAEYPPLRALRRLVGIAHGNPLHLAMLAREIHERGAVRARAGGAHFLDTSALDELSPAALGPWLAARELTGLADELVALARLCAVLGEDVRRGELVAIVDAVDRAGGATTTVDVDVGLRELVGAGILVPSGRGFAFRQPLVEEGIYTTTDEHERSVLHRAALEYWRGEQLEDPRVAERIARHAEAVGSFESAAAAFTKLGDYALREQRALDADPAWSGALRNLQARTVERGRALLGRARARSRLQRMYDALADLDEALMIARETSALELELEVLIEQSTVLDHCENFERSKEVATIARERLDASVFGGLAIDLDLATGRSLFRAQRYADAAPLLRSTLAAARAHGRGETETISALMLGCALSDLRELDEAEVVFAEMIEKCRLLDDRYHLGAAYGNRAWLWSARGEVERTEEDLRLVIQLAREGGQPQLERASTHNLAEHRLWQGELDEALQLARRGLALQTHGGEGTTHPDRLLVARVLAARGDREELADVLTTFAADEALDQTDSVTLAILRAVATVADEAGWRAAVVGLDSVFQHLRLELARLARGHLDPIMRAEVIELARRDPIWSRRIGEL